MTAAAAASAAAGVAAVSAVAAVGSAWATASASASAPSAAVPSADASAACSAVACAAAQARQAEVQALLSLCRGGIGSPLPFLYLRVRRTHLVEDTLQQIASSSNSSSSTRTDLRKALKVKFIGEEGIDQGGVTKEFFQLLVDEVCKSANLE